MTRSTKRLLALLLAMILCVSLLPATALAEEAGEEAGTIAPVEETEPPAGDGAPDTQQIDELAEDAEERNPSSALPPQDDSAGTVDPETLPPADGKEYYTSYCGARLYWDFDYETGTLEITGSGNMYDFIFSNQDSPYYKALPWIEHCAYITTVIMPNGLTKIGNHAFCSCRNLTEVTIPEAVTRIGFAAFKNCSSLTSIAIPESVTEIGDDAFLGCSSLEEFTVGQGNARYSSQDGALFNADRTTLLRYPAGKTGSYSIPESVTSIGNGAFSDCSRLTSITIPEGVTSIGSYAFSGCSSLTSITIPEGVTSIGYSAFSGCSSLTSITIPEGVTSIGDSAFSGCSSLTSITLPAGVTSIGYSAFSGCSSLTSITIPAGVTSIGYSAFSDCSSLTSIILPAGVTSIGDSAFSGCSSLTSISIPEGVTSIGDSAFSGCSSLTSITIPEGVTSIRRYAFYNCSSLTSVTIPEGVTSIGDSAFSGCSSLSSITIPDGVTYISSNAFSGCAALTDVYYGGSEDEWKVLFGGAPNNATMHYAKETGTTVYASGECGAEGSNLLWTLYLDDRLIISGTGEMADFSDSSTPWGDYSQRIERVQIQEGVTSIGRYAFKDCDNLTSVVIADGVTSIGGCTFEYCSSLTSITIPESVTSIGWYAFSSCSSLKSITIPESVTSIGDRAFLDCSSLTNVSLPDSVTSIGYSAFSNCSELKTAGPLDGDYNIRFGWTESIPECAFYECNSLTSVTIPDGLTSIGKRAFCVCSSLTSVTIPESVTSIGDSAFSSCSSLTSVTIPEDVTSIGSYAFEGCSSLTSVTIPESVTSIGVYAFKGCSLLKTAGPLDGDYNIRFGWTESIPEYAFYECSSLTSITIPEGVTSIGKSAFYSCSALTSVTFPDSITSIRSYAFSDCSSLTSVSLPATVKYIDAKAFYYCDNLTNVLCRKGTVELKNQKLESGDWKQDGNDAFFNAVWLYVSSFSCGSEGDNLTLTLEFDEEGNGTARLFGVGSMADWPAGEDGDRPYADYLDSFQVLTVEDGVTSIGDRAFLNCSSLTNVSLPDSVTSIGEHAFNGCASLAEIEMPENASKIGLSAFAGCSSLEYIEIPQGITSMIGVFAGCSSLKRATVPEGVTELIGAFSSCSSLEEVALPSTLETIGNSAFSGCTSLTGISIPDNVTLINTYAFADCSAITQITIPSRVTGIAGAAFSGCSNLKAVVIPDSVTRIGDGAFMNCSALESVVLSRTLTVIPGMAFSGCSSLKEVVIPDGVYEIGIYAFADCTALEKVTIPGTLETLKGAAFYHCSKLSKVNYRGYLEGFEQIVRKGWTTTGNDPLFNADWTFKTPEPGWNVCGPDLLWRYNEDSRVLEFKGKGPMLTYSYTNASENDLPWKEYAYTAVGVRMEEGATSISDHAFCGFTTVASVSLPNSLRRIGTNSFCYTYALTTLTIPENVSTVGDFSFESSGLREIFFKGPAPDIGTGAFTDVTATAYYPTDDETWTEEVRQNYGGDLTWIPYTGEPMINVFTDVAEGKYYYEPVLWAYYHDPQITGGISDTEFGPSKTCTREQIVTFLWKAMGAPEPTTTVNPFQDVKSTKYYYKAVLWAVESGITGGMDATHFGVGKPCTREQAMTFLWKACGSPEPTSTANPFVDVKSTKYYYKPVLWAVENGITGGVDATHFGVGKPCTRGQIVTFLYKALAD